jgi:signal transduction histidine kinase
MDWYIEEGRVDAVPELRHAVRRYLDRHAEPGGDLDAAEVVFSEIVTNALRHAGGPTWITPDWSAPEPVLTVRDLGPGFAATDLPAVEPSPEGASACGSSRTSPIGSGSRAARRVVRR